MYLIWQYYSTCFFTLAPKKICVTFYYPRIIPIPIISFWKSLLFEFIRVYSLTLDHSLRHSLLETICLVLAKEKYDLCKFWTSCMVLKIKDSEKVL